MNAWLRHSVRHPANWVERPLLKFNAWFAKPRSPFDWALAKGLLRSNRAIHRAWRFDRAFRVAHGILGLLLSAILAAVVILSECWHRVASVDNRE